MKKLTFSFGFILFVLFTFPVKSEVASLSLQADEKILLIILKNENFLERLQSNPDLKTLFETYGKPISQRFFPNITDEAESAAQTNKIAQKYDLYFRAHRYGIKVPQKPRLDYLYAVSFPLVQNKEDLKKIITILRNQKGLEAISENFLPDLISSHSSSKNIIRKAKPLLDYYHLRPLAELGLPFLNQDIIQNYTREILSILNSQVYPEGKTYQLTSQDKPGYYFQGRPPVPFNSCLDPKNQKNFCVDQVLSIRFKNTVGKKEVRSFFKKNNYTFIRRNKFAGSYYVRLPQEKTIENELSTLSKLSPIIWYAEPVYKIQLNETPNDTYYSDQWSIPYAGFDKVWKSYTTGSSDIMIGVFDYSFTVSYFANTQDTDSSYLYSNALDPYSDNWAWNKEEYDAYLYESALSSDGIDQDGNGYIDDFLGWDFCYDSYDYKVSSEISHGTKISSLIGSAITNNNKGIAGLLWETSILPISIIDVDNDSCDDSDYLGLITDDFLEYASARGVRVTNFSYSYHDYSETDYEAYGAFKDTILYAAAIDNDLSFGLDNDEYPAYPASYKLDNIIAIANINSAGEIESSYGKETVHVAAPGTDIPVINNHGEIEAVNGTSFATPHVAALAALLFSYNPDWSVSEVRDCILKGADGSNPYQVMYGTIDANSSFEHCTGEYVTEEYYKGGMGCGCHLLENNISSSNKIILYFFILMTASSFLLIRLKIKEEKALKAWQV